VLAVPPLPVITLGVLFSWAFPPPFSGLILVAVGRPLLRDGPDVEMHFLSTRGAPLLFCFDHLPLVVFFPAHGS